MPVSENAGHHAESKCHRIFSNSILKQSMVSLYRTLLCTDMCQNLSLDSPKLATLGISSSHYKRRGAQFHSRLFDI